MYQRLTELDVAAVERGLAAGMRHAEIAREFDLSVWTIAQIADRRRFERDEDAHRSPHAPREEYRRTRHASSDDCITRSVMPTVEDLPEDDGPADYEAKNLQRCPGCGAMIYVTPCIACQMATMTQPVPPAPEIDDEPEADEPRLTTKQRRWRRKRVRKLVLGEA